MIRTARRKFPRAPIHVVAACTVDQHRLDGTLWQIGEGGLFIELPMSELPQTLALSFELPGHGTHRVVAKPVWRAQTPPKAVPLAKGGAGCAFADIGPKTREAVQAYVKKMKQTYSSLQFALALARPSPQLPQLLKETGLQHLSDLKLLKEHVALVVQQLQPNA